MSRTLAHVILQVDFILLSSLLYIHSIDVMLIMYCCFVIADAYTDASSGELRLNQVLAEFIDERMVTEGQQYYEALARTYEHVDEPMEL